MIALFAFILGLAIGAIALWPFNVRYILSHASAETRVEILANVSKWLGFDVSVEEITDDLDSESTEK